MKKQQVWHVLLAWMIFLPGMALAQVTASIGGAVQDTSGAVIPGAAVTVKSLETGAARTLTTNDSGNYRALALPVGRYEVSAEKAGFKTAVRAGINLVVGQEAVVNLSLDVGEVQQAVTVTAEAAIVNTTTVSTSGLVGEREVKDLPLNGRSFDNLITLNPGTGNPTTLRVNGGAAGPGANFNIAGRRGTDNLFLLNGIEYTGSSEECQTPGGASGQLLGIDAVREFNVQANTYGAEYGKRYGGQVAIVTMSGTNQLHGTLFEFFRSSALDARNFFDRKLNPTDRRVPVFRRNDFGGSAGGPIRKDKTFIFGNYEGYRQALTTTNVSFVPDNNARQGFLPTGPGGSLVNVGLAPGVVPLLAIYPLANGPSAGGGIAQSFQPALNPVREDFGTLRADELFTEKDSLSGAFTIDDGISVLPAANPYSGFALNNRLQVLSVGETHTFSPSVINTARAGFSRASVFKNAAPLISLPASLSFVQGMPVGQVTVGGGTLGAGALSPFGNPAENIVVIRNLFTYTDSVQIVKGKHQLNIGGWAQRMQVNQTIAGGSDGAYVFADLQHLLQGQSSQFSAAPLITSRRYIRSWEGAWYVADTIRVTPKITLTLGLRHEFTNGWNVLPLNGAAVPTTYVVGPGGVELTQPLVGSSMFTDNKAHWLFGPRVGVSWDPSARGRRPSTPAMGLTTTSWTTWVKRSPSSDILRLPATFHFPFRSCRERRCLSGHFHSPGVSIRRTRKHPRCKRGA